MRYLSIVFATMSALVPRALKRRKSFEDTPPAFFEALCVVNSLSEATEAWWECFEHLSTARCVALDQEEDVSWFPPLIQAVQEHYNRLQALYQQAFGELVAFAHTHRITLRIPLERPYSERSLSQLRILQREQAEREEQARL